MNTLRSLLGSTLLIAGLGQVVFAEEVPAAILERLVSDDFRVREAASADLVAWSRARSEVAMDELFELSRSATDPEARERCLAALRVLVGDLDRKSVV